MVYFARPRTTLVVSPSTPIEVYATPDNDGNMLRGVTIADELKVQFAMWAGGPAGVLAAANALADAFTQIANAARQDCAEGWTDPMFDGPLADITESELRLLAGDR